jgi:hypothetical protein
LILLTDLTTEPSEPAIWEETTQRTSLPEQFWTRCKLVVRWKNLYTGRIEGTGLYFRCIASTIEVHSVIHATLFISYPYKAPVRKANYSSVVVIISASDQPIFQDSIEVSLCLQTQHSGFKLLQHRDQVDHSISSIP